METKVLTGEVEILKSKGYFRIKNTISEKVYLFRYDYKEGNLYLIEDGKKFTVRNPGSALYAFAAQKSYFEVLLESHQTLFLENIIIC